MSRGLVEVVINLLVVDQEFIEASATEACTRLIETSAAKWRQEEGDYRDDITAICVRIDDVKKEMASLATTG